MKRTYWITSISILVLVGILIFLSHKNIFIQDGTIDYTRPGYNIILISVDTLRADHLYCYGYERETSPNIDRIAREALLFENAISQSAWTLPSHASLMTGLLPSEHGLIYYDEDGLQNKTMIGILNRDIPTLAQVLKRQGYLNISFNAGAWVDENFGLDSGFHIYQWGGRYFKDNVTHSLKWIQNNIQSKFFLFLHAYDVHTPYNASKKFNIFYDYQGQYEMNQIKPSMIESLSSPEYKYIISQYDAGIRRADYYLGLLFDLLDKENLMDRTIIIITSDHGEMLKKLHDKWGHIYPLYEELIKVPVIIRIPGVKSERIKNQVPGSISIAPTVLDILDIKNKDFNFDNSLMNFFSKKEFCFDYILSETGRFRKERLCRAIRTDKWKLMFYTQGNKMPRCELFDLENDKAEQDDIAKENPDKVRELLNRLLSTIEEIPSGKAKEAALSKSTIEQLKALGYIKDK